MGVRQNRRQQVSRTIVDGRYVEVTAVRGKSNRDFRYSVVGNGDRIHVESAVIVSLQHVRHPSILEEHVDFTVELIRPPVLEQMRVGTDEQAERYERGDQHEHGNGKALQCVSASDAYARTRS